METLYPGPMMLSDGSAACPLPKATVGAAQAQSSSTYHLAQENIKRLSNEALTLSMCWFIPQSWESSMNKNEQLSSPAFDELCTCL